MGNLLFGDNTVKCRGCSSRVRPGIIYCLQCRIICEVCTFQYSIPGETKCINCRHLIVKFGITYKPCPTCYSKYIELNLKRCNECTMKFEVKKCQSCFISLLDPSQSKCYECRRASYEASRGIPDKLCYSCGTEKVTSQDALCNGCRITESLKKISLEDKKKKEEVQRVVTEKKEPNLIEGKRYFGLFVCGECHNSWQSANSWLGMFQKCKKCSHKVQPRKLKELIKREDVDGYDTRKRHPRELCQKCQQLGHFCRLSSNTNI